MLRTMKEACEFCMATIVPDMMGRLVTSPSVSRENSFRTDDGVRGSVCEGAAAERQVIWDLFTNTIQAAKVLKMDEAFRRQLEEARARIRTPEIGKAGHLLEWGKDWDLNAPEPTHRHVSHLFTFFPGRQIAVEETPALAAAVKKSLELSGGGSTGWAKAGKINLWARLHVELLGGGGPLAFARDTTGLVVTLPETKPNDYAYALRIDHRRRA